MRTIRFTAAFTGVMSKLPDENVCFKPPFRVEKGHPYRLEIDQVNGKTAIFDESLPVKKEGISIDSPLPPPPTQP